MRSSATWRSSPGGGEAESRLIRRVERGLGLPNGRGRGPLSAPAWVRSHCEERPWSGGGGRTSDGLASQRSRGWLRRSSHGGPTPRSPGTEVVAAGTGFSPSGVVQLSFDFAPVGEATADGDGSFFTTFAVPDSA